LKDEEDSSSSSSSSSSDDDDSDSSPSDSSSTKAKKKFSLLMQKNLKFSIDLDAFLSHDLMYLMKNFAIKYQENDFKAKVGKLIIK